MDFSRRLFLKTAGLGLVALGLPPSFLVRAAEGERGRRGQILVVVFQRGGMDGLNAVIPFRDRTYYSLRPSIAIPEPASGEERAIDLDGFYGLHPTLAPLKILFDKGHLAVIHATGSPDNTRSHFDAQDYMELGTPGVKNTPDGWLNRVLAEEKRAENPFQAVALTQRLPRILAGRAPALTMTSIEEFRLRDSLLTPTLQKLYANVQDPLLRQGGQNMFEAMKILRSVDARLPSAASDNYPNGRFGAGLKQISRLIKANIGLEIAFTEIEGWDTHVNEGGAKGQMANRLTDFAAGLAAFYQDLGNRMDDVVLLTLSEFGRTARENGNRGTDHGHANVMFAMGGRVRGGKVYGRWPGLAPELLYEGRDLALTTDFRAVCGEILSRHLGQRDLSKVFPSYSFPSQPLGVI
ncbi:MAG TPA: DUF1501 domain-containing protein [Candidatus Binatia bacterium]|jgi:uncharacterized protein (DUF1501 family)|nr:DUF1501 domain-containing protein [Candidatus Binatia bacterium]